MNPLKVLIIDDSALVRCLLSEILSSDPDIQVVGRASDPIVALPMIQSLKPDVLTLDVEMPRMDGLTFLEKLMRANPMPVVMVSSLTERGCDITLRALALGAVDYVPKPHGSMREGLHEVAREIIEKVKGATRARVRAPARSSTSESLLPIHPVGLAGYASSRLIALGASTGGTEALAVVLQRLPEDCPPVVIVQHMPERFTLSFAQRLDSMCAVDVAEAKDGDAIRPGRVLIAPGGYHMEVHRGTTGLSAKVFQAPPVNHHRPSVDVLFRSCARLCGANTVAALLTGMGADGARGMLELRQTGARTIAQNEETCVVFGMPAEAIRLGAAEVVLPLPEIAAGLLRLLQRGASADPSPRPAPVRARINS
jgi:two-component system chemotaxis response regulator CheB